MSTPGPITIPAPEPVLTLLDRLHTLSEAQEATLELRAIPPEQFSAVLAHQFVALERDKCAFVYHLARAMGATTIVEVS
jgi:hypothetical protein